jgi:hypothetical protein
MRAATVPVASIMTLTALGLFGEAREAGSAGPFQYHTLTPCRLVDTRKPDGTNAGPILSDGVTRDFQVQGWGACGVPAGAKAVSVNVTAVAPNGPGYLTLFALGTTQPTVSNLNFSAGVAALGNGAIVSLAEQSLQQLKDLTVFPRVAVSSGQVHVVIDVTGYFQ